MQTPTPHYHYYYLLWLLSTYHFIFVIHISHTRQRNTTTKSLQSLKSRAPRPNAILLKFNIYLFVCPLPLPLLFNYVKPTHHFSLPPQDKYCSSQYNPFLSHIVKKVFAFFLALGLTRSTFPPFSPLIILSISSSTFISQQISFFFLFFTTNGLWFFVQ